MSWHYHPSHHHKSIGGIYIYHSQSWLVYMIVLPTFEYNLWESFWKKWSLILEIISFFGGVLKVIVVLQIGESCCLASRFCMFLLFSPPVISRFLLWENG